MLDKAMPDIAHSRLTKPMAKLDKVGMRHIETPIHLQIDGSLARVLGHSDAFVNIVDPASKGIHMSRLFLLVQQTLDHRPLSFALLHDVVDQFIESHKNISDTAHLAIHFTLPLKRKALKSEYAGWRGYPLSFFADNHAGKQSSCLEVQIQYSSTCPCSAALARQLIQDQFMADFGDQEHIDRDEIHDWLSQPSSILATPHGQRSTAKVRLYPKAATGPIDLVALIDGLESTLATPVQTAVKRVDEQEFARLNGQNLMFAEDAARRLIQYLETCTWLGGFEVEAHHHESLHPHDAVAMAFRRPL